MTKHRYDFLCGCLTLAVAVLKAVVKTSPGRDSGYGLNFGPGPILRNIGYTIVYVCRHSYKCSYLHVRDPVHCVDSCMVYPPCIRPTYLGDYLIYFNNL